MADKQNEDIDIEKQKEMQQKYMEMQYIQQHLAQYQKQLEQLDTQLNECDSIKEGLDEISKKEPGTEVLVPISNGIFAKANLADKKSLIVNVGSNVAVEKNIDDTKVLIQQQKVEIEKGRLQMTNIISSVTEQMQALEKELAAMAGGNE